MELATELWTHGYVGTMGWVLGHLIARLAQSEGGAPRSESPLGSTLSSCICQTVWLSGGPHTMPFYVSPAENIVECRMLVRHEPTGEAGGLSLLRELAASYSLRAESEHVELLFVFTAESVSKAVGGWPRATLPKEKYILPKKL